MIKPIELCCLLGFLPVLGLAACAPGFGGGSSNSTNGNGQSAPPIVIDMSGSWSGTWTSSGGGSGSLIAQFLQPTPIVQSSAVGVAPPSPVSGTITLQNSSCFGSLDVDATAFLGGFGGATQFYGTWSAAGTQIDFSTFILVGYEDISGTYEVLAGGVCTGETGTLSASKTTAIQESSTRVREETFHDADGRSTTHRTEF